LHYAEKAGRSEYFLMKIMRVVLGSKMKKRELEAMHQLSKNRYDCIGDPHSMITKYDQFSWSLGSFNHVK
jgi:hypothetical protein